MDHVKHMQAFLDEEIIPAEARHGSDPVGVVEELKAEAKRRDLWNLFRPGALSNVDFAPIAELTGWSLKLAPEAVNAMAPDVENMIMLDGYATPEQRNRWLDPLLDGTIRSAFTVAEPDVASSDVTRLATTIRRDSDSYVITGRKYFIANAPDERCRLFLVMGRTDTGQHFILVGPPLRDLMDERGEGEEQGNGGQDIQVVPVPPSRA
jgi:acyl-CoA dehydrogenase